MPHKIPFRVVHVSGQDDNHKAVELNTHSPGTSGWQSARFCLYPQDIIIQLERRCQLRKIQILSHQHLIATKIEFFVGDCGDGGVTSVNNASYRRLGYVGLSDNEKTSYRARELKSVHVDAVGVFLKLVVHKNYVNKHNLYNQVGIIAINVIGDSLIGPYEMMKLNDEEYESHLATNDKAFYISPMEDLAFDLYQDPQVADIIRRLEKKKQQAVSEERFEHARLLRDAVNTLQLVGEKLGRMEIEKKQAIETEDYERAHLKKQQIEDYRAQAYREAEVDRLLSDRPFDRPIMLREETPRPIKPMKAPTPRPVVKVDSNDNEERPLPALQAAAASQSNNNNYSSSRPPPPPVEPPVRNVRRPVEPPRHIPTPMMEEVEAGDEMSEADRRQAAFVIEVFGSALVSRAYSKIWSHRENALLDVYNRLRDLPLETSLDDKRAELRAAVFLVQRGLKDKVYAVFRAAWTLTKMILVEFVDKHDIPRSDVHAAVDKVTAQLLARSGDTAIRLRDAAKTYTVEMSEWPAVHNMPSFYHECLKPLAVNAMDRYALSRMELVADLYAQHGLGLKDFNLDAVMSFCANTLQHKTQEVREAAELLIVQLYRNYDRAVVRSYLPPDDMVARKNPLFRRLFEKFDMLDTQMAAVNGAVATPPQALPPVTAREQKTGASPKRPSQVAAAPPPAVNRPSKVSAPPPAAAAAPAGTGKTTKAPPPLKESKIPAAQQQQPAPPPPLPEEAAADVLNMPGDDDSALFQDHTCIFCCEESPEFTKVGLDSHYWKSCVVLSRCPNCSTVVEVCNLTSHLLNECPQNNQYKQCPRCKEAIQLPLFQGHIAESKCNPVRADDPSGDAHCPLCHENIDASRHDNSLEEAWRAHLMGIKNEPGCAKNPRRIAKAYQQEMSTANPPPEANKPAKAPSQLPKPVSQPRKSAANRK